MVPNSLKQNYSYYGTEDKRIIIYLDLAGVEMPCFALTEPNAGSDAGAMQAHGIVFKGDDGELYLKLNWNKRYITLAAISTVLGLAFKLEDPDNLLGKGTDLGITCALVPSNSPGVILGEDMILLGFLFIIAQLMVRMWLFQ